MSDKVVPVVKAEDAAEAEEEDIVDPQEELRVFIFPINLTSMPASPLKTLT